MQRLLVISLLFLFGKLVSAQVITSNDSFEGTPQSGTPPNGWESCEDGYSTVDTQPGQYYNNLPPSHGNSYISLVTRSVTSLAGTVETVYTDLINPIEKDRCYTFQIDLSLSESFNASAGFDTYYFDNPCVVQMIGFNGSCESPSSSEVLWESEPVSNIDWQTYNIEIMAENDTYTRLAIRPMFYPEDNWQNSAVMIDHLRIPYNNNWLVEDGGLLFLSGNPVDIQWYFNGNLVSGATGTEMPVMGSGMYSVTFVADNGCLMRAEKEVLIDYDAVSYFPNPTRDLVTVAFFSSSEGIAELEVYNDIGQRINSIQFNTQLGKNRHVVDLSGYAREVYFLRLSREESNEEVIRIVKMQ